MNVWLECYAPLIGRIFVGGYFVWHGMLAAINFPAAVQFFTDHGIQHPLFWVPVVIIVELVGGAATVTGLYTRPAALLLALFLLVRSSLLTDFTNDVELNIFLLNLGLVGGLLYIAALDRNWARQKRP